MAAKLTTEEFIAKAVAVHGSRYDYSQAVYQGSKLKLNIVCLAHGLFEQSPDVHIGQKAGCTKCAVAASPQRQAYTKERFVAAALAAHGDKYDYSKSQYVNSKQKVAIQCAIHGEFTQSPASHINKVAGCPKCGFERTADSRHDTQEGFLVRARVTHGTKYDYSQTAYRSETEKIKILCPTHGAFSQSPARHTSGQGCRRCGAARAAQNMALSTAEFIARAQAIHSQQYDYSLVSYKRAQARVSILCPSHGVFTQAAGKHLQGDGCPRCGDERTAAKLFLSTEQFIERATVVHGNTYNYAHTTYAGHYEALSIICPAHGLFTQKAGQHLGGHGCTKCATERHRAGWIAQARGRAAALYFLRIYSATEEFYKVGITLYTVAIRYAGRRAMPRNYQYEILAQHTSTDAARIYDWEQSILQTFAHLKYTPKQPFGGASECFSSCEEILAIFPL